MTEFDALGRDVVATADSTLDPEAAGALKALWRWAGFEEGENPNHLWTVTVDAQSDRFSVSAAVKAGNVYVSPPVPDAPASVEELARSQGEAEAEAVEPVEVEASAFGVPADSVGATFEQPSATVANATSTVTITEGPGVTLTREQAAQDAASAAPEAPQTDG